jgi:hypothetical protein
MSNQPQPPKGTGPAGRRPWRSVNENYELSGADLEILKHAASIADDIAGLEPMLKLGPFLKDPNTGLPRANPALVQKRQLVIVLARLLSAIRVVGDAAEDEHDRPQRRVGFKGTYGGTLKAVK